MIRTSFILILSALVLLPAQPSKEVPLVTIGGITITQQEFVNRYELLPAINRRSGSTESNKAEFLLSMIAEKLLVLKAQQEGWDADTVVSNSVKEIERMLVRDELFRKEVQEKIVITDAERQLGMRRSLNDLKVYFLFARTKEGADSISRQIKKGKALESFLFSGANEEFFGPDSAVARFGDMDERMENAVYALRLNETSAPFRLDDGWYIVKLMGKTVTVMTGEMERKGQAEKVESVLRKRKELARMTEYMNAELKQTRTDVHAKMMKSLIFHLREIALQTSRVQTDTTLFFIDQSVVENLRTRMKDSLAKTFVTFPHTVWSLEWTLHKIITSNLAVKDPTLSKIRIDIEQRLRDLIDQEYLVQSAYRRGMHQLPAVREELKVWRDSFVSQIVRNRIADTVSVTPLDIEELRKIFHADSTIVKDETSAREKVKQLKVSAFADRLIGESANSAAITFYEKNFRETQVTNTATMVYRYLGFGGRMFPVPFVTPQQGWIKYWDNKNVKLP